MGERFLCLVFFPLDLYARLYRMMLINHDCCALLVYYCLDCLSFCFVGFEYVFQYLKQFGF